MRPPFVDVLIAEAERQCEGCRLAWRLDGWMHRKPMKIECTAKPIREALRASPHTSERKNMTPEQLQILQSAPGTDYSIGVVPGPDRTLLYGYDCDRNTWHTFQKDGQLHKAVYLGSNREFIVKESGDAFDARHLIPNKRLYPEACDFTFCLQLKRLDLYLSFTTFGSLFDHDRRHPYVGRTF